MSVIRRLFCRLGIHGQAFVLYSHSGSSTNGFYCRNCCVRLGDVREIQ